MQKRSSRQNFRVKLEEMVQSLRDQIISGHLAIDSYLPSESDLEIQFQLSNSSVRKGLEILVQEGLIQKIPRVGNRVVAPSAEQTTTVKFGYHNLIGNQTEMTQLIEKFHQLYPHIQIQLLELPTSRFGNSIKGYMEAQMLDVVMFNNNNFQDFIESGSTDIFEPLPVNEDIYPFLTAPFMKNNYTLVQPFIFSPVILCYNKEHLRQQNVPEPDSSWSWNDLIHHIQQLAITNQRYGFYCHLLSRNRWPVFMLQSGVSFDLNAKYLENSNLLENLEICRRLLAMPEVFPLMLSENDNYAETLFLEEKVSVIMTTYFSLNNFKNAQLPFDVAPLPCLEDSKTLLIIVGLAVNSKSRSKEAAKLLVDFLVSYEAQSYLRQQTYNIPAHRRAVESQGEEALYRPSRFFMYRETIPSFRLLQHMGLSNKELEIMQKEIMMYLSGLQDHQTLYKRVEEQVRIYRDQECALLPHPNSSK